MRKATRPLETLDDKPHSKKVGSYDDNELQTIATYDIRLDSSENRGRHLPILEGGIGDEDMQI